jgi:Putative Flp pilus-assembly TadE/G-like
VSGSRPKLSSRIALGEERGSIFALSAVVIAVFLLLAGLVVDVGNWYVHKRQLQNRADAGAFAAGVDYSANWAACMQNADTALKTATADAIAAQARRYAGDPTAVGPYNTEIANQANVNVVLNSTSYTAGTDGSDGGGPCFRHAGDEISPSGGYWMDVRVQERDLPSLFGPFGMPLSRNTARARIEIHPAVSDRGFIPLAVPETEIVQAQVRYYDECTSPRTLLASANLKPLKPAYQTVTGTVLWGPDTGTGEPAVDPTSIPLTIPPSAHCLGSEYIPVGVEMRIAGRPSPQVDLNQECSAIAPLRFADCWSDLSRIRVYKDTPSTEPWFQGVVLTGSGTDGCSFEPYFARNRTHCTYEVSVNMDVTDMLGSATLDIADNFTLSVNGTPLSPSQGTATGSWASDGTIDNTTLAGSPVRLSWSWEDRDPTHVWGGVHCTTGNNTPCKGHASDIPVHKLFLATDDNAGVVDMIRTSLAPQQPSGQPGYPLDFIAAQLSTYTATIYPTIGLRSALTAGQYRVLRAAGPQGNQSVDCEPSGGQGHDFQMFLNGCQPYYGFNHFGPPDRPVWWTQSGDCPNHTTIFSQPNGPSDQDAWKCVPSAPGFTAGVMADGIAARTGNCDNIQNNACSRTSCNYPSHYPSTPDPEWAPAPGDPRVVNLFVVPYGAFKGINAQDGLPITKFPRFYVTGWGGNGSNNDPCPDDDPAEPGEIVGYFIAFGEPGGPVDHTLDCIPGDLTPCRTVLVY